MGGGLKWGTLLARRVPGHRTENFREGCPTRGRQLERSLDKERQLQTTLTEKKHEGWSRDSRGKSGGGKEDRRKPKTAKDHKAMGTSFLLNVRGKKHSKRGRDEGPKRPRAESAQGDFGVP